MTYTAHLFRRIGGVRVPVIRQTEITDCGAACLAMILRYHGREVRLSELRAAVGGGRDGTSGALLVEAAESYHLAVDAVRVASDALEGLQEPAILHWEASHFVVLEKLTGTSAVVVDPSGGRRRLTRKEFDRSFSGVAFLMTPASSFTKHDLQRNPWSRYWELIRGARGETARVLASSVVLLVIGLAAPAATALVIDKVIPSGRHGLVTLVVAGAIVFGLVHLVVSYSRALALLRLQSLLDRRMTSSFVEHVLSLPFGFFQNRTIGGVWAFLNSLVILRDVLSGQFISMILDAAMVGGYFLVILKLRPSLAAIALGVGAVQAVAVFLAKERIHLATQEQVHTQSRSQGALIEILRGIETVKSVGLEATAFGRWRALHERQVDASMARELLGEGVRVLMSSLAALSPIVFLAAGASAVMDGQLSAGTMLGLIALAVGFLAPLSSLLGSLNKTQVVGTHLDRIEDVYEEPPERTGGAALDEFQGRIEFEHVSFRYSPHGPLVLKDVSFCIEPNSTFALVGPSGSGKSTVAKLILGLYTPTEGRILIDDKPLAEIDLLQFRRRVGVVPQATFLFNDTVARNIAFDAPDIRRDDIVRAANLAVIHSDIMTMPMQYETIIGESGGSLSGGQRQRICLARALARRPRVLLFDEATSELDVLSERAIESMLRTIHATRILIAHRVSTVRSADTIAVFNDGEIVERGTHQQLMRRPALYHEMVAGSSALEGLAVGS
jgi:ABC-type bacteriocin/lantibiotic exporter with double-glycine peptidase domain